MIFAVVFFFFTFIEHKNFLAECKAKICFPSSRRISIYTCDSGQTHCLTYSTTSGSVTSCCRRRRDTPVWVNMEQKCFTVRQRRFYLFFFQTMGEKKSSSEQNLRDVRLRDKSRCRPKEKIRGGFCHCCTTGVCSYGDKWISWGGGTEEQKTFSHICVFRFSRLFLD